MSKMHKLLIAGGVAAAAISLVATATTAFADPPSGVTPKNTDIVGTGSDTTQFVVDQLASDWNATHTSSTRKWYSFDAVDPSGNGSTTIQEKAGCDPVRTRPNGSSAGIAELEANLRPTGSTTTYCVDFARSSRARSASVPADPNTIVFLPFAIDGVTWSADTLTGTTHATKSLTPAQLNAIYSCDDSTLGGNGSPVTWNEVGGTSTNQVVPVIPQSSSGTRKFFLGAIGNPTLGSCVVGNAANNVEENEGVNAVFQDPTTAPDIVFPYSIAVFLAQSVHNHGAGMQGNQVLRRVSGIAPTTGTGTATKINSSFPLLRNVFNVVRNAAANPATAYTVPTYLRGIFGNGAGGTGWICANTTARADIQNYGFLPMTAAQCGKSQ